MRILITGSSAGIGRGLTKYLLEQKHHVWGLSRSDQSPIAEKNEKFHCSKCDITNYEALEMVSDNVSNSWPHLDALICCAGTQGEIGSALTSDPLKWSQTVYANLNATYYTLRAFAHLIKSAPRRPKIICFSGGGATKARPNFSAYGVAKCAIVRLVETIAVEENTPPIDINAIAPGAIYTRMTEELIKLGPSVVGESEYHSALSQKKSDGSSLMKVYGLVSWLLSQSSDGVSGRLLSAPWDDWPIPISYCKTLASSDTFMLRRVVPEDKF